MTCRESPLRSDDCIMPGLPGADQIIKPRQPRCSLRADDPSMLRGAAAFFGGAVNEDLSHPADCARGARLSALEVSPGDVQHGTPTWRWVCRPLALPPLRRTSVSVRYDSSSADTPWMAARIRASNMSGWQRTRAIGISPGLFHLQSPGEHRVARPSLPRRSPNQRPMGASPSRP